VSFYSFLWYSSELNSRVPLLIPLILTVILHPNARHWAHFPNIKVSCS